MDNCIGFDSDCTCCGCSDVRADMLDFLQSPAWNDTVIDDKIFLVDA